MCVRVVLVVRVYLSFFFLFKKIKNVREAPTGINPYYPDNPDNDAVSP
jgi:hypothetical protein